ncbi:MAG: prolyl oligopeptidase family serine peptidase [Gemmataceae bacterium]|nr:prolyl oligopeptidase family serine peptidase [Gemmataceae bacterium]
MPRSLLALSAFLLAALAGCKPGGIPTTGLTNPDGKTLLADAPKGFATKLARQHKAGDPVDVPPPSVFRTVQYDAPVGKCAAYLTPDPKDGKKRPAIVWITGGDCNTIGDVWKPAPPSNDQSARQFREAGVVMMFPSLRGGNQNPGFQENFYGEVDDVLAAAEFLAKQDFVDPARIYLGGHSTGGTLVMLVAAVPNKFRAVFSFGPAEDISGYEEQYRPAVNMRDAREVELRSPGRWLHSIQTPTFVFEGTDGNADSLKAMANTSKNPKAHFYLVKGASHFSILTPVNKLIAQRVIADTGTETNLTFTEAELNKLFGR